MPMRRGEGVVELPKKREYWWRELSVYVCVCVCSHLDADSSSFSPEYENSNSIGLLRGVGDLCLY